MSAFIGTMCAMNNEIERPAHYDFGQMEAREIIELAIADFRDPATVYHVASALKYLLRASRKNGADDIAKARKHVVWAEQSARAHEWIHAKGPDDFALRHGDIDKICGGIRDAGEFTQPPNCSPGVSKPTPPMHAVALEMVEAAMQKRRNESAWGVTWPGEPQPAYQTLVGN